MKKLFVVTLTVTTIGAAESKKSADEAAKDIATQTDQR